MDMNPYAPPASPTEPVAVRDSSDMPLASKGQRFANLLVDYIGAIGFAMVIGVIIGIARGLASNPTIADKGDAIGDQFIGIAAMLGYYILLEALTGRTLGKLVTGTKVVSADGSRPSFWQILGRTFARFLPFEPLSFFGRMPGWHDGLSRTRVIRTR